MPEKKPKSILVRFTEKDFAQVERRAGKMGHTPSAFVRFVTLRALSEMEEKKGGR